TCARQVGEQNGGKAAEFDGEIPVAYRIERVAGWRIKAELMGRHFPVDGVGGSRECGGAEWTLVESATAVLQTGIITIEHFVPRHQMVAEGHRLSGLQVSEAGHDGFRFPPGQLKDALLQPG